MIAHLGMYDMPHAHAANDALWSGIRAALGYGPETLTRDADFWTLWRSPDLLFAQTCGLPFRAHLHDQVALVGTPDYGLPGCPAGYYYSVFVCRQDDPRGTLADFDGATFAYNEALSQSGWAAPTAHMSGLGLSPGLLVETGGHALSAAAVADGRADFAALDALTHLMLASEDPDLTARLRVLERTEPTPGLPYITSLSADRAGIASAVATAIDTLPDAASATLHLRGLVHIPAAEYRALPLPHAPTDP